MIKSIEKSSVHRITSGQVLVDLQTAVKELLENSLDAGATTIDVKFKDYGVTSFEVSDNGMGIAAEDYENVAMKHCTSKLATFEELTTVQTFGFRGEALSSLCALSERVTMTTATAKDTPMGTVLEFDNTGQLKSQSGKVARQRGTTVHVEGLFVPLPVRRKEFQRNSKREFGKALTILNAYALVPCSKENKGVRLSVVHLLEKGRKSDQIRTDGKPSLKASISSLWGPKQVESLAELNLDLEVVPEKIVLRRQGSTDRDGSATKIKVRGYISKFSPGNGRTSADRQFFYINGRPCNPSKIQKAFNEVYRSFNVNQVPFIIADFIVPTDTCDINVSPDKRTILLHSENALVAALKEKLEMEFAPARSTFVVQTQATQTKLGTQVNAKMMNGSSQKSDAGAESSQDTPIDFSSMDSVVDDGADVVDVVELQTVQRSPTPIVTVPDSLLEPKDSQQASSRKPSQAAADAMSPHPSGVSVQSPSSRPSPSPTSYDLSQPVPTSPAPLPARHSTPPVVPTKPNSRPVQMVLDTTNASWTMRPASEGPAQKKRRVDSVSSTSNPRIALRSQLRSFASSGSRCAEIESEEESDESVKDTVDVDERGDKDDLEADQLVDGEMEVMMDPEADLEPEADIVKERHAEDGVESNSLFLPEPDEVQDLHSPAVASRVEEKPIDFDVETTNEERMSCTGSESRVSESNGAKTSVLESTSSSASYQTGTSSSVEFVRTTCPADDISVALNLQKVDHVWDLLSPSPKAKENLASDSKCSDIPARDVRPVDPLAGLLNTFDEESAKRELARVIDKDDFARMQIVGQFNLGFIIARRRIWSLSPSKSEENKNENENKELDDLFIIDQHAADEKYNFETLQQTTRIDSQKLFRPRPLELTAADELLALENIDVLKANGFEIAVDENAEPSQGRIKLIAQPVSGSTDFDMKDLEELLHLMQDKPAGQKMVRCSKARSMFAMRACRKSVMIGMALNKSQMVAIVRHMGTMDQPWNCPHGRPTMRHLTSLNDSMAEMSLATGPTSRDIKWGDL